MLPILLAEVGALGPDEVEQLQADGRDAPEVAGPGRAFGSRLLRVDPRCETAWIHLVGRQREDDVDSFGSGELEVVLLVARVRLEVGLFVELSRVDEQ